MARFCGIVGYAESVETSPGVWEDRITERKYFGDITRIGRTLQSADKVNDDIGVSNVISIVADPFANQNFHWIKYIVFQGAKWKISNVEVSPPRLILTLGGLYNGK